MCAWTSAISVSADYTPEVAMTTVFRPRQRILFDLLCRQFISRDFSGRLNEWIDELLRAGEQLTYHYTLFVGCGSR
jgi:hypothetical protein